MDGSVGSSSGPRRGLGRHASSTRREGRNNGFLVGVGDKMAGSWGEEARCVLSAVACRGVRGVTERADTCRSWCTKGRLAPIWSLEI